MAIQFAIALTTKSMLTLVDNTKMLTDMITTELDYSFTRIANLLRGTANWMQLLTHSMSGLDWQQGSGAASPVI